MAGILTDIDKRTNLAGTNRLELLIFTLNGGQKFGINVFKIQEVIQVPKLTRIPGGNPVVRGVAQLRGKDIPVMDMSMAIGEERLPDGENSFVIITEFNRSVQGFLVGGVDRIVNLFWKDINPPPEGTETGGYVTALTEIDGEYVLIIDVEKILSEVSGAPEGVSAETIDKRLERKGHVLVVDDSTVAQNQVKRVLDDLGLSYTLANDGKEGLDILRKWVVDGIDVPSFLTMVISDVEMPRMDGYTLTTEVRKMPALDGLYIMLHTSLSGVFNETMVERVGADIFMAKYKPDELAAAIQVRMRHDQGL
ncbi:MAG: chemotaxis protein CheW [Cycloclasticus sp. symbiont of Bathymodiolus heckerae]|nr:MAG: chemotaxis protein CheW [Cycloclasticus sp. symbiont of Bathymodiolus heckerae]